MPSRFPTLNVNVGHIHNYLDEIEPGQDIGVVASAAYPPPIEQLERPALRATVKLLDPVTFQLQLPSAAQPAPFRRLPYAESSVDPAALARDANRRALLIDTVVTQSRAWGADYIIAPYFHAIDPGDPALNATLDIGNATVEQLGHDHVVPAVFVHENALLAQHRDELLNRLTRTDFESLYLLVGVDSPSTAPIADDAVLAGIRLVVEVLARNDIEVVWGATDSTGLLATAWAPGTSYALGPETYLRRRLQPPLRGRRRCGFKPANRRVFAPELLSELRVDDYQTWSSAGRIACTCAACQRCRPVEGRRGHYVNSHAGLTRSVANAADPLSELASRVDTAIRDIGAGPSDVDARRHLAHWRDQLP